MPRPGGEANKIGNQYEAIWTVDKVIDVFKGAFKAITVEPVGDISLGVEFYLETNDNKRQFHSVKRQTPGPGWSIAKLCREDKKPGRSILGDLFNKRHSYPNAETCFVSSTGANELRELSERAQSSNDLSEFRKRLSPKLRNEFNQHPELQNEINPLPKLLEKFNQKIVPICNGDEEFAFSALKSFEVITRVQNDLVRTVEQRISDHFYRTDRSPLNPDDIRRMIAEFVLDHLGTRIDADHIRQFLQDNGISNRDWKTDLSVNQLVKKINQRYREVTETELINSAPITRNIVEQILGTLRDPDSRGALLVAPGGFGKSCVLAQCLSHPSVKGTPHICLRMDSMDPCNTTRQLGEQLDLPASPAVVLAGIADNASSVLVVDQLDAMSLVSGRNPRMWEVFNELRKEAQSYPYMKMILACRDFDLNHDHRLRGLGDSQSGITKHTLEKLDKTDILESLRKAGQAQLNPTEQQLEILGVPLHLLLFLQGNPAQNFNTVGELYDQYWDRKRQNLEERLGRESHWDHIIDALTRRMSEQQVLFAPKSIVDNRAKDAKAMISEHVLVEDRERHQYRFFHESFFDYAFARRFCVKGGGVVDFLVSTEQHLFRRAQVRQILAYRREEEFDQYLTDVREIFDSQKVRFHIKRMVASGFGQIDKPTPEEWSLVKTYLLDGDLSRYMSAVLSGHVGWFDLLDSLKVFENWLVSDDTRLVEIAIRYLEIPELHDKKSTRIAELIAPYVGCDGDWRQRILRIMSWGKAHQSRGMTTLYLDLIAQGAYDDYVGEFSGSDFWSQYYNVKKKSPKFIIDVLGTWFERVVKQFDDGKTWNFLDKCKPNHSQTGVQVIEEVATKEPQYFVEKMLPHVTATVLQTEDRRGEYVKNRLWPFVSNNAAPYEIEDAILLYLRKSLQHLAKHEVELFRHCTSAIAPHPHETFAYFLLRSWADNPQEFADECASYLLADQRRLNVGYISLTSGRNGTNHNAISRIALREISPYCSLKLFEQLESRIIGYCQEYEKRTPELRGYSELLLLRSLDVSRISEMARSRIEELERKFPDLSGKIVEEEEPIQANFVESPIPKKKAEFMTDDQWISAMRKYDGSTDFFQGGPRELSGLLTDFAGKDPDRFASLAMRMPDDLHPHYFSAILDGLCSRFTQGEEEKRAEQQEIEATPTETFLKIIDRLHSLPDKTGGSSILHCIQVLSDRSLPPRILEIVSYYATSDPDPERDIWQTKANNGNCYYSGDPYEHGIHCIRGRAAQTIASLLYGDQSRLDALRPALESLSNDPVVSVRTCAVDAFLPLLNFNRDLAVDLFLEACGRSEAICTTEPFRRFVRYAKHTHYTQLRELLQFALHSKNTEAVENAALQITLAELEDVDVGCDAADIRTGSETMRKAAARVYAGNLLHETVGNRCAERLQEFFDDDAKSIQQEVSRAFFKIPGERLLQLKDFISRFIESKAFENGAYALLHILEESNVELPEIICPAADRILEFVGQEGTNIAYRESIVAQIISKLIVRQYQQTGDEKVKTRCLDIIDRMEQFGFFGIGDELKKIDR